MLGRHHGVAWRRSMYSHEWPQPCNAVRIRTQRLLARLQQQVCGLQTWYDGRLAHRHVVTAVCMWGVHTACNSVGCLLSIPKHTLNVQAAILISVASPCPWRRAQQQAPGPGNCTQCLRPRACALHWPQRSRQICIPLTAALCRNRVSPKCSVTHACSDVPDALLCKIRHHDARSAVDTHLVQMGPRLLKSWRGQCAVHTVDRCAVLYAASALRLMVADLFPPHRRQNGTADHRCIPVKPPSAQLGMIHVWSVDIRHGCVTTAA